MEHLPNLYDKIKVEVNELREKDPDNNLLTYSPFILEEEDWPKPNGQARFMEFIRIFSDPYEPTLPRALGAYLMVVRSALKK